MAEYREEMENREQAIFGKNDRIRELELEIARNAQAMLSKDNEVNQTKSKLNQLQDIADKS